MAYQFKGLPFENQLGENLCFCNSGTNALLSSEKVTSGIMQDHCFCCDFLYGMKNSTLYPIIKSARPLKAFVAQFKEEFRNNNQQDADEFIQCLFSQCEILRELTKSVVIVNYKCKRCGKKINKEDERNVFYENIDGSSIAEIISSTKRKFPTFLEQCSECRLETQFEKNEEIVLLPDVLIVNLQRVQRSRSNRILGKNCTEIEPSVLLTLGNTIYSLNAVVTHYGRHLHEGHYVTTLWRNDQWICCNDDVVLGPTNEAPKMGYLFFYDRVDNGPLPLSGVSIGNHGEQGTQATVARKHHDDTVATLELRSKLKKSAKETSPESVESLISDHQEKDIKEIYGWQSKASYKRQSSEDSDDTEKMVCKNCNAYINKSIFHHFARTKTTKKCGNAYSKQEINDLQAFSHKAKKLKQKEYKERNKEKITQQKKTYQQQNKKKVAEDNKTYKQKNKKKFLRIIRLINKKIKIKLLRIIKLISKKTKIKLLRIIRLIRKKIKKKLLNKKRITSNKKK